MVTGGGVRVRTLTIPDDAEAGSKTRDRAALAIARALGVTFAEAGALVSEPPRPSPSPNGATKGEPPRPSPSPNGATKGEPRVLPGLFDAAEAEALVAALTAAGVAAESFAVAAAASTRCATHPRLGVDVGCRHCSAPICTVCQLTQAGHCRGCHLRLGRRRRFARLRIGVLLVVLVAVGLWALGVRQRRQERTRWRRPLDVAVVLLGKEAPPPSLFAAWERELPSLERWLSSELGRYPCGEGAPIRLHLGGPLVVERLPAYLPDDDQLLTRARHAWTLGRTLAALDARVAMPQSAVRIYVLLEPTAEAATVEGAGEVGGDVGFVRATRDDDPSFALVAVAHELFHCLGATDKYDAAGHARAPDGLVEPARGYPQSYAEIMVGEVPLAPARGRNPAALDEVRIGAATAAELRCR
jgi:hypothetical protein